MKTGGWDRTGRAANDSLRAFGLVAALLSETACSSPSPSPVPPQVGLAVAHDAFGSCEPDLPQSKIVWSADGSEIFYVAYTTVNGTLGPIEIEAAKADGSGTRVVEAPLPGDAPYGQFASYGGLASPPDGSALYYTVDDPSSVSYSISEAFNQGPLPGTAGAVALAASSDDVHVAYAWRTLSIYDRSSGAIVQAGTPYSTGWSTVAFSPTGDQLFVAGHPGGATVDLSGNLLASTPLLSQQPATANWNADGIRVLLATGPQPSQSYQIQNVTSGAVIGVATPTPARSFWSCTGWSPDGNTVAFWNSSCSDGGAYCLPGDAVYRTDLYLVDAASGAATWLAGIGESGGGGDVAFSPDGSRLAYIWGSDLYVSALP